MGRLLEKRVPGRVTPKFVLRAGANLNHLLAKVTKKDAELTPELCEVLCSSLLCTAKKAIRDLGYRELELESMLADCHDWMKSEGMLQ